MAESSRRSKLQTPSELLDEAGFASLAAEGWEAIRSLARPEIFPAGTQILRQRSPVEDVYFIHHGQVKLAHVGNSGKESIVCVRSSGWPLGAAAVILNAESPMTAITVTPCHITRVPAAKFLGLIKSNAQISLYIHQAHSREIYDHVQHSIELATGSGRARLERLLRQIISAQNANPARRKLRLQLPLKQWEIAQLIAVTPQYLSRLWKKMEDEGLISREKGWLIITDHQKFLRRSNW